MIDDESNRNFMFAAAAAAATALLGLLDTDPVAGGVLVVFPVMRVLTREFAVMPASEAFESSSGETVATGDADIT